MHGDSKTCSKCGDTKPLSEFYVDRRAKDGHMSACKLCVQAAQKTYNCDATKLRERQRRANTSEAGRARTARHRRTAKYAAARKRYRQRNREKQAAAWAVYYEANRDELLTKRRAWNRANPEKKRAARDPEKMRRDRDKRRALLLNAYVEDVPFDVILQRDLGICGICNAPITETTIELDHIIPLAAGGQHEQTNVQLAHRACNRRKWTTTQ